MAGALEGVKILELSRNLVAQFATMMLADMGADVLKIEIPPRAGQQAPVPLERFVQPDARQIAFDHINRNKRSIAVNLQTKEGQEVLHKLVERADVLIEGFRPGVMKRLGSDYETLNQINPRLIYCSLSGYGQSGPYKDLPGHDINYISFGGILSFIGETDKLPTIPVNIVADYASGTLHGVIGALFALYARERTGKGQFVDVSYLDGVISLAAAVPGLLEYFRDGRLPKRGETTQSGRYPYYATYETKDGKLLTLGCIEPWFWERVCRVLGKEEWVPFAFKWRDYLGKPSAETEKVTSELREIFKTRTRDEWFELLKENNITVGKVYTWDEVLGDPQVIHRNMVVELEDPVVGKVRQVGIPIKLSETPGSIRHLAPRVGEHTEEVAREIGYSTAEIALLKEKGIIHKGRE